MITILEGVDGVGKSALAKRLADFHNAELIHAGPPTARSWLKEYILPLTHTDHPNFVLDRWHMGEMIWPTIFGRRSLFENIADFNACNRILHLMGAEIIILRRQPRGIRKTLKERGELGTLKGVLAAQNQYLALANRCQRIDVRIMESDDLYHDWRLAL